MCVSVDQTGASIFFFDLLDSLLKSFGSFTNFFPLFFSLHVHCKWFDPRPLEPIPCPNFFFFFFAFRLDEAVCGKSVWLRNWLDLQCRDEPLRNDQWLEKEKRSWTTFFGGCCCCRKGGKTSFYPHVSFTYSLRRPTLCTRLILVTWKMFKLSPTVHIRNHYNQRVAPLSPGFACIYISSRIKLRVIYLTFNSSVTQMPKLWNVTRYGRTSGPLAVIENTCKRIHFSKMFEFCISRYRGPLSFRPSIRLYFCHDRLFSRQEVLGGTESSPRFAFQPWTCVRSSPLAQYNQLVWLWFYAVFFRSPTRCLRPIHKGGE